MEWRDLIPIGLGILLGITIEILVSSFKEFYRAWKKDIEESEGIEGYSDDN